MRMHMRRERRGTVDNISSILTNSRFLLVNVVRVYSEELPMGRHQSPLAEGLERYQRSQCFPRVEHQFCDLLSMLLEWTW